ncbi:MAG: DUF4867 family protein [Clostridiaceae bacterium]
MIDKLNKLNNFDIKTINDVEFKKYGCIVSEYDFNSIIEKTDKLTEIPSNGNVYVGSDLNIENDLVKDALDAHFYGQLPCQIGYCNGKNSTLNGLEYHKGSEIDIAVTDLVLLLGDIRDIENNTYSSNKVEAFYLKKGEAVELYGTSLHFAPCKVCEDGFKCIVILPKGTNEPLENKNKTLDGEDKLLFAKNKWLIIHPEREILVKKGAYIGIKGENIEVLF